MAGCSAGCGSLTVVGGAGFFAFLPATCNQRGTTGGWIGLGAWVWGAAGTVAACVAAGLGVGVGEASEDCLLSR